MTLSTPRGGNDQKIVVYNTGTLAEALRNGDDPVTFDDSMEELYLQLQNFRSWSVIRDIVKVTGLTSLSLPSYVPDNDEPGKPFFLEFLAKSTKLVKLKINEGLMGNLDVVHAI